MSSYDFSAVDQLLENGARTGVFPGAGIQVQSTDQVIHCRYAGVRNLENRLPVTGATVFDLASLTKPLATAPAVWLLVQEGAIKLFDPIGQYLPGIACGKATIRELLCHRSGLPAHLPFYEKLRQYPSHERRRILQRLLLETVPECPPGTRTCYSDLGYMCLSWLVEAVSGIPFDTFILSRLYALPGLSGLHFPGIGHYRDDSRYAATEACSWRGFTLCGEVHDDNAWAAGGIQGHAGLFGNLADVGALLIYMAGALIGLKNGWPLSEATMKAFFQKDLVAGRTPGLDVPSGAYPSSGRYFGPRTVGHLGFTGTSFWMDPEAGITVILLTNRVHPHRDASGIREFRPLIHDAVMQTVLGAQ